MKIIELTQKTITLMYFMIGNNIQATFKIAIFVSLIDIFVAVIIFLGLSIGDEHPILGSVFVTSGTILFFVFLLAIMAYL